MTLEQLYLEAARVAKLIEGTKLEIRECIKINGRTDNFTANFTSSPETYEFALAIVESKPVFKDDNLFNGCGVRFPASYIYKHCIDFTNFYWNPPKPKTVLVELLHTDVEVLADSCVTGRISIACRKALESLK